MALTPGLLLMDRYRLTDRIAVGGMGEVWAAEDGRLGRPIAVKILRSELTSDPEFVSRFRTEARITASLNHSGIASVYDYGEVASIAGGPQDTAFLVMELVSGEPLSAVLSRQPKIAVPRVLDVLEQSGRALQVAHLRQLVHRDIKPGNILITPAGQVKITDFGIAKAAYQVPITQGGMVMGTAQYLSPEQAAGSDAVPASDIYALGVVAYECLAGERPFNAENPVVVASMQVNNPPPPLPADVPPAVADLVLRMLAKDPRQRFPDGAALAEAVAQVRAGRTLGARQAQPAPTTVVGPVSGPVGTLAPGAAGAAGAARAVHDAQLRVQHGLAPMPARVARRTGVSWTIGLVVLLLAVLVGWYLAHRAGQAGAGGLVALLPLLAGARPGRGPGRVRRSTPADLGHWSGTVDGRAPGVDPSRSTAGHCAADSPQDEGRR